MSRTTRTLLLHGDLERPAELTVEQLRRLPAQCARVTFDCRTSGARQHTFEGPKLWDVLRASGSRAELAHRKARLRHLLTVTGADGHVALLSWAEIDPEFGGQQILLATSIDDAPLDDAGPQLVVPGDSCGARYISGITEVWVGALDGRSAVQRWEPVG
jgi:DMSO/TMAO reductase YedYZ molybdopterin-dependent catalytic subunit